MVAYSFQRRFIAPIQDETKLQTIRGYGKRRHAVRGEWLQLYAGMRTRHCTLIKETMCAGFWPIELRVMQSSALVCHGDHSFAIGSPKFTLDTPFGEVRAQEVDLDALALADGFTSWPDMRAFWAEHHPELQVPFSVFQGAVIKWQPDGPLDRGVQTQGDAA